MLPFYHNALLLRLAILTVDLVFSQLWCALYHRMAFFYAAMCFPVHFLFTAVGTIANVILL